MDSEGRYPRRILLADNKPEVRSALRLLLDQEPDLRVVAEAAGAEALLSGLESHCPDLVMVDWDLPSGHSQKKATPCAALIASMRSLLPGLGIVVLGGWPGLGPAALLAGADGFVSKVDPPERVLGALRASTPGAWDACRYDQGYDSPPGQCENPPCAERANVQVRLR